MDRKSFIQSSALFGAATLLDPLASRAQTGQPTYLKTVNVRDFGAKGDGATDDTEAIQKALDALEDGCRFELPIGVYPVSETLVVRKKQNVLITGMGPGARLVATAPMQDLLHVEYPFSGSIIESLTLDANTNAHTALRVMGGGYVQLNRLEINAPRDMGIHAGPEDPEGKCGPELIITNSRLTGMKQPTADDPASRLGILVEKRWTDSHYDNLIIRGFTECGIELRANSNLISKVHTYRHPAFQYFGGMRLKGNENYLVQAYFDNAINVGCEILGNNTTIFSSYVLRIKLAFNNGPVAPGVGIRIGSHEKKVKNVSIINTSFVNHVPDTPGYAANKLDGIELVNGENVIAYDNQYDRASFSDTRVAGEFEIEPGIKSKRVAIPSLVTPGHIQLTPLSYVQGAYWVGEVEDKAFTIHLSKPLRQPARFGYLTRETLSIVDPT
ncbi:MAG: glycoside hydrolase family 55 protein [Cytophagales bacterium]|nr:glycoside hydrolase family 55 protein [Cytophagales bacterium]